MCTPMEDAMRMAPSESREHLIGERLDTVGTELVLLGFHVFFEVEFAVFKTKVELVLVRHVEHVLQPAKARE